MEKPISSSFKPSLSEHSSPDGKFLQRSVSLAEVRARRKLVEQNARLLANRLNVLQQEKVKLGKTIADTQVKAYETYQRRLEREQTKVFFIILSFWFSL